MLENDLSKNISYKDIVDIKYMVYHEATPEYSDFLLKNIDNIRILTTEYDENKPSCFSSRSGGINYHYYQDMGTCSS